MTSSATRRDIDQGEGPRERLRFDGLTHDSEPDGRCRITVGLEWRGRSFRGESQTLETHEGRVRGAAEASLVAARTAAGEGLRLNLIGVKAIRAFDGWVLVVRILAEVEGKGVRLLGASSTEEEGELERASVQAVLDATNRVLGPTLSAIPEAEPKG